VPAPGLLVPFASSGRLARSLPEKRNKCPRMEYKLKRGFSPDMNRIRKVLEEEFAGGIDQQEGRLSLSYGALKRIEVWVEAKHLNVTTESQPGVDDQITLDTNRRFRNFLEKATGYTAKQRLQMAKKEISGESQ
jgi:hypothetical protein